MEIRTLLEFLKIAEKLKCNTRHCFTSSGRRESVAEHSWRLALMADLLREEFPELDIARVVEMCLVHDLGEAVTGDIPAFEKTKADSAAEADVVLELFEQLPEPQRGRFETLWAEMEAQRTPEAKLYKALDKLEALIQHNESDLSTWIPLEYELQMTYGTEECEAFPYLKALRDAVREDSRRKMEDSGAFPHRPTG